MATQASEPSLTGRSKSEIEADLGANRDRLAALRLRADRRGAPDADQAAHDRAHPGRRCRPARDDVRAYFFNARGDVRTDHVVTLASVAAGTLTVVLALRALLRPPPALTASRDRASSTVRTAFLKDSAARP